MKPLSVLLLGAVWLIPSSDSRAEPLASDLRAVVRHGQVFLTWREQPAPAATTLNVYVSARPITDPGTATRAARSIEPHSARDWWQDPASFTKGVKPAAPVGFVVDQADRYAITVRVDYPGLVGPVHTDVTPRRLQRFTVQASKVYTWRLSEAGKVVQSGTLRADSAGRLTVPRLTITAVPRTLVLEPER